MKGEDDLKKEDRDEQRDDDGVGSEKHEGGTGVYEGGEKQDDSLRRRDGSENEGVGVPSNKDVKRNGIGMSEDMKDRGEPSKPSMMELTKDSIWRKDRAENEGGGVSSIQDVKRNEERMIGDLRDRGEPSKTSTMGLTDQDVDHWVHHCRG